MAFRSVANLCATLFAVLAAAFFFVPDLVTSAWGLRLEGDAVFMGQRLACYCAGGAVMLFLARDAGPSPARRAIALGFATALVLVAGVGVLALLRGTVTGGILVAVLLELVLAAALVLSGRRSA